MGLVAESRGVAARDESAHGRGRRGASELAAQASAVPYLRIKVLFPNSDSIKSTATTAVRLRTS